MKKTFVLILIIISFGNNLKAQNSFVFKDSVYKNGIETVLIYKKGWQLSFPIISIDNPQDKILLTFDEIGSKTGDYSWKIKHCNFDWTESDLDAIDYIDGFDEGYIADYTLSKNTKVDYINYQISFPNEDLIFRETGNYVVIVYENNDPEQIVLTKRFYVYKPEVDIQGNVFKQPVAKIFKNQTVNFTARYNQNILSPTENLKFLIIKNGEDFLTTEGVVPSSVTFNTIAFEHRRELSFPGINEYRHFDIKSVKFLSDKLQNIENADKLYKILLRPDEILSNDKYNYKPDLNGKRFIKLENNNNSNFEADYCEITFRLAAPLNINSGDYYVYGALSDWKLSDKYKMHYNAQGYYTATLFLKQGYYNYRYVFKNEGLDIATDAQWYIAEGNFYQTENDYFILCYYSNPTKTFDEIVGFLYLNTEE